MEQLLVILAVVLRIFSNPLANVFQKKLTNSGSNALFINFATYALLGIICIYPATFFYWGEFSNNFWIYALATGAVGGLGNAFLVKALELGDLSVLGPVNAYKSVVAMIVALFLLGEIPGIWGLAGVALIIFGSYFVIDTIPEGFSWKVLGRKEIQYRILAMIFTAIEAVLIKKVIVESSSTVAFFTWCWFGALFSVLLLMLRGVKVRAQLRRFNTARVLSLFLVVVCIGIMQFTTNYSFEHIPVGYALSFFQLSVTLSVLFGYKIFKEKDIGKKLLGSVIMIVGAVLIILADK